MIKKYNTRNLNKISRFGVEKFINCPKCFYYQYRHSIKAPYIPFSINIGIDNLFKNEFDYYREKREPHPIFIKNNLDLVPFKHELMDKWRDNFKGIEYHFEDEDFIFGGAVDDVWVRPNGELIIADMKATSSQNFYIDEIKQRHYFDGYVRQLEMYQWLFQNNGFKVSNTGYILYANGRKNEPMFENHMKFDLELVPIPCDNSWVEEKVKEAVVTLRANTLPSNRSTCEQCGYLHKRYQNYLENQISSR